MAPKEKIREEVKLLNPIDDAMFKKNGRGKGFFAKKF